MSMPKATSKPDCVITQNVIARDTGLKSDRTARMALLDRTADTIAVPATISTRDLPKFVRTSLQ